MFKSSQIKEKNTDNEYIKRVLNKWINKGHYYY